MAATAVLKHLITVSEAASLPLLNMEINTQYFLIEFKPTHSIKMD